METFWARLKTEIAWIRGSIHFETRAEVNAYLFEFIEILSRYAGDPSRVLSPLATSTANLNLTKPRVQDCGVNIRFGCERFVDAYSIGSEPIGRP